MMTSRWGRRRRSLDVELPSRTQHTKLMSLLAGRGGRGGVGEGDDDGGGADPWIPASRTTLPHEGFSARNQDWIKVQHAVVSLFQQKKLEDLEMAKLYENVRNLVKSDVGPFIYDYYKNQLMKRGMTIIREHVRRDAGTGSDMLAALQRVWACFFTETLPMLQAILHPVQTKDLSIRQVTILGFRDHVLFHFPLEGELLSLSSRDQGEMSAAMVQMLLVLQHVKDSAYPSDSFLRLEGLVALVVYPYLGYRGLYLGTSNPVIPSSELITLKRMRSKGRSEILESARPTSTQLFPVTSKHSRQGEPAYRKSTSIIDAANALDTVVEVDPTSSLSFSPHVTVPRRHSVSVTCVT